jgi:hypothetical protein
MAFSITNGATALTIMQSRGKGPGKPCFGVGFMHLQQGVRPNRNTMVCGRLD